MCNHRFKVYGLPQFHCTGCGKPNPELETWDGEWSNHPWLEYFSSQQLQRYYARGSVTKNGKRLMGAPGNANKEYGPGVLSKEELKRRYYQPKQTMRSKDHTKRGKDTADLTGKRKFDNKIKFLIAETRNGVITDIHMALTPDMVFITLADYGVRVERQKLDAMLLQCMSGRTFATKTAKEEIRLQISKEGK